MATLVTDDFLKSMFEKLKQEYGKSTGEDDGQKCSKKGNNEEKSQAEKNKQLEDSGQSAALDTSQDSAEDTEDSAEVEDTEDSAEDAEDSAEDAEDSAEAEDAENSAEAKDAKHSEKADDAELSAEAKHAEHSAGAKDAEHSAGTKDAEHSSGTKDAEHSTEAKDAEHLTEAKDAEHSAEQDIVDSENRMKAPICLIENLANGKLVVNPKAIDVLSRITQPVVVVAIVGMYRTGKSYLMNKLAGVNKGFNLGSTVQSETKGIWMWCVPHPKLEDHTLVLLDTEGLGDVEKGDCKNDTSLFSLALLLSSALVYNSRGTIDQDALDKLKFVGEVSNLIQVKTGGKKMENEQDYSTHFPIFVWTVRDFLLELKIDGKEVTADDYMEKALRLKAVEAKKKLSRQDAEFNKVRKILRNYFGKRKCFTFDLPTADKHLLHKLEEISEKQLNPDFVAQGKIFCDYVFENAKIKTLDVTVTINGERLSELAKIYTEAISTSKIACLEEAVVSLSDKENQIAVQEAVQYYQDKMKEVKLPTKTTDDFFNASRQYEEEARKMFLEKSFRDDDQRFLREFLTNLQNIKNEFCAKNEKMSLELCEAHIKKHSADFEKALLDGTFLKSGGHGMYIERLLKIEIAYNAESEKGVKGEEVLQDYLKSKKSIELVIIQEDNTLSQREKEMAEEKNVKHLEEMEAKLKAMEEEYLTQKRQQEEASLQMMVKDLVGKMEEEREVMNKKLAEVLAEKERERAAYMKEAAGKETRLYQQKIDELQKKIDGKKGCIIS